MEENSKFHAPREIEWAKKARAMWLAAGLPNDEDFKTKKDAVQHYVAN